MESTELDQHTSVLLEEYRAVSTELALYIQELMRCGTYALILVAGYLGLGVVGDVTEEQTRRLLTYVPYAFVALGMYFLAISTIRINLSLQRAALETQINARVGAELMGWDSRFTRALQRSGVLRYGPDRLAVMPTPMLLFACIVVAGTVALFGFGSLPGSRGFVLGAAILALTCYAAFVFLVYPHIVEKSRQYHSKAKALAATGVRREAAQQGVEADEA